jgi:hypothetical protein
MGVAWLAIQQKSGDPSDQMGDLPSIDREQHQQIEDNPKHRVRNNPDCPEVLNIPG